MEGFLGPLRTDFHFSRLMALISNMMAGEDAKEVDPMDFMLWGVKDDFDIPDQGEGDEREEVPEVSDDETVVVADPYEDHFDMLYNRIHG